MPLGYTVCSKHSSKSTKYASVKILRLQRPVLRRDEAMSEGQRCKFSIDPLLICIMVMSLAAWSLALYIQAFSFSHCT